MLRRTAGTLILLALVTLSISCRRLEGPGGPGSLSVEPVRDGKVLPADWGNLVSVTSSDNLPNVMLLWLQDSAGNVRVAAFSLRTNQLTTVTMLRRQ
jgi:hypothetical protein